MVVELTHELIPLEVLFGNPEKISPHISPDGTKLSYIAPHKGVLNVWVASLGGIDKPGSPLGEATPVTSDTGRGIRGYFWQNDSQHILYVQDQGGDENWRLYQTDIATKETRALVAFEGVQTQIVKVDRHIDDEILIALNKDDPALHDLYRLNLSSGELMLEARNPGTVVYWFADGSLCVRAALAARADGGFDVLARRDAGADFAPVISWSPEDSLLSTPLHLIRAGTHLYLRDTAGANTARLVRFNLLSGEREIVAEDPEYDVSDIVIDPSTYEVQAASFLKAREEWSVLDPALASDFQFLSRFGCDFSIASRDRTNHKWVIEFVRDDGPISYYLYDTRRKKAIAFLFDHQSTLANYALAKMSPVSFVARDGLVVHGYLTLPRHVELPVPLVLTVHGGPWVRDVWGFDSEAQWIANRGWACLQVNFRGSTGYGKQFANAGDREWGGKMHDDLIDAVEWAVSAGVADPKRVAIYGASYGGYAALVGATFTPDVFCCAVSEVGPSNLLTLLETVPSYWSNMLPLFYQRIGHPERDREFLISRSPLFKVDRIIRPLLIIQGENDPRVKRSEADQIVKAMSERSIPHEYLLIPDEGHGFAKPEARLLSYQRIEEFLARYLQHG